MAAILKCKICGGDIEVSQDMTIGTCLFCGSTMTLPKIDSDKKARLFNRAHEYRLNCEFDKAYDAYKSIVDEDEQEAEAYWGMLLSEYGVEYVDDPKSGKKVPTCHRIQIKSMLDNANYTLACKYAHAENKMMYRDEAEIIDELRKRAVSISYKEAPYDVFICYKETDDITGDRTEDSVLAQDIYDNLTDKGLKVFFSRITLEDKLGTEYEPYIFSALNSAKVMLLVTTSSGNANAVWVKNEWSRFIWMMKDDKNKVLIPVIKNLTAYELPNAISGFQAQDMGKVGAIQDLVRGVMKIVSNPKPSDNSVNLVINDIIENSAKQKKNNKILVIAVGFLVVILATMYFLDAKSFITYKMAIHDISKGEYKIAEKRLNSIPSYKDSDAINYYISLSQPDESGNKNKKNDIEHQIDVINETKENKQNCSESTISNIIHFEEKNLEKLAEVAIENNDYMNAREAALFLANNKRLNKKLYDSQRTYLSGKFKYDSKSYHDYIEFVLENEELFCYHGDFKFICTYDEERLIWQANGADIQINDGMIKLGRSSGQYLKSKME